MKKVLLLMLFCVGFAQAQIVNIPDANFKARLIQIGVDTNADGEIQESEASSITQLAVGSSNISDLTGISSFVNLTHLNCQNNELTSLDVSNNVYLTDLLCSGNQLTSLDVSDNVNLSYLYCSHNQLVSLDGSNIVNLTYLYCENNQLTSLDLSSSVNLIDLECQNNELTSLDVSNSVYLTDLLCGDNQLTSLDVSDNVNLTDLYCGNNPFTSLDLSGNINLTNLNCEFNQLTSLDISNNINLTDLDCSIGQLTSVDVSGCINLDYLDCSLNQLTSLNFTNCSNLRLVYCNNNQLTSIEILGNDFLEYGITASSNNITEIDFSNYFGGVSGIFDFGSNPIEFINIKNGVFDDLFSIEINNFTLQSICVDTEEASGIINNIPNWYEFENALVTSYCTFTPGGNNNTITGDIRFDANNDGCDAGDLLLPNIRLDINDGIEQGVTFTNPLGSYVFYTQEGDFILTPSSENSTWFNISPSSITIPFADSNNNTIVQDFCVTAVGVHNDLEIVIVPIGAAQPGFDASYSIIYKNKGNQTLSGTIDFTLDDTVLDYVSSSVIPDSQASGNLSWNYNNLTPFESRSIYVALNVNAPTDIPPVNIGHQLDFLVTISPETGDETPFDNSFAYKQTVVGSYDPNDKVCLEGDIVEQTLIGDYLHYIINFENTGTAAATFVVVKDEIDETMFDMNTLQLMSYSHPMETRIIGNKVEFIFDIINLGPNEKGNVVFKIKTKNTLIEGDSVTNKADIFFDYNFPIETNDANTLFQTLSIAEYELDNSVAVFPNPTTDNIHIKANTSISSIEIYDIQGRLVVSKVVNQMNPSIDMSSFIRGVYFLKIKTIVGAKVERIIRE